MQLWLALTAQEAHAIAAHFPVAIGMLAPLLLIALVAYRGKQAVLRWVVVGGYAVALAASIAAVQSGEQALEKANAMPFEYEWDSYALMNDHEEAGGKVWMFVLAAGLLTGLTALPKPSWAPLMASIAALIASLACAAWIGYTASIGGELVYRYGVGPPKEVFEQVAPQLPPPELNNGDETEPEPSASTP